MYFCIVRDTNEIDLKCILKLYPPYFFLYYIFNFLMLFYILFIIEVIFTYHVPTSFIWQGICKLFVYILIVGQNKILWAPTKQMFGVLLFHHVTCHQQYNSLSRWCGCSYSKALILCAYILNCLELN